MLALRRSRQTVVVLAALLRDAHSWHYGYDLLKETGLKSGTLYPILGRLKRRGWLQEKWEKPAAPGRPPRHLCRLSRNGRSAAAEFVVRRGPAVP
jgi:DNA-binding PadR family transcriptional regulator